MSTTFKIVGPLPVAERLPGETLSEADLDGLDISHLIEAGHIAAIKKGREATETQPEGEK